MGKIVRSAADDIKACANGMEIVALNHIHRLITFFFPLASVRHVFKEKTSRWGYLSLVFSNLNLEAVKVLKGPIWDVRLLKFVEIFAKRRSEFEFALSIHTSLGVDAMNAKMDLMLKLFQRLITPEQKEMARSVVIFLFLFTLRS
jgi:hypothetical protein